MEPLTGGFLKNIDETEFGGDIKLRRNGSQHAIPNPYSTSEARSTCTCLCCGHVYSMFMQSKS